MKGKTVEVALPDSGVTLRIKRISPMLLVDLRKNLKRTVAKPEPPMQEVLIGDEKKLQPNDAHPDYLAAMQEYNSELGLRYMEAIIKLGVECEVDQDEVRELRESAVGPDLPEDDKVVYVSRVAVTSERDMQALQNAILGRSQPTEGAAQAAADSFPNKV